MLKLSSKKLVEILDIKNKVIDVEIENVVTDSRKIKKGDLFIALRGENFDALHSTNFLEKIWTGQLTRRRVLSPISRYHRLSASK